MKDKKMFMQRPKIRRSIIKFCFLFLVVGIQLSNARMPKSKKITISGSIEDSNPRNKMVLYYWSNYICSSRDGRIGRNEVKSNIRNGHFSFEILTTDPLIYFSLGNSYDSMTNLLIPIVNLYVAEMGDNIFLKVGKKGIESIDGKGSFKLTLKKQLDSLITNQVTIFEYFQKADVSKLEKGTMVYDSIFHQQLNLLTLKQKFISSTAFQFFITDITAHHLYDKLRFLYHLDMPIPNIINIQNEILKDSIYASKALVEIGIIPPWNNQKLMAFSINTNNYLVLKAIIISKNIATQKDPSHIMMANYNSLLREKLLANYFLTDYGWMYGDLHKEKSISEVMPYISDSSYRKYLDDTYHVITDRNKKTDFVLLDKTGKKWRLSDFRGKTILLDFWFTGCEGCIDFYEKILSKLEEHYKNSDSVLFISISPDMETTKWIESVRRGIYTNIDGKNILNLHSKIGWKDPIFQNYDVNSMPHQVLINSNGDIVQNKFERDIEKYEEAINNLYH
ncbi:TlpA family protein disulfide reductase [Rhizosphaericola mali]|uniref:TlpA family protein disulfide reductase n=1 Tax=Rhizosphaericola mali TaxID=2545455 RepID=A0A5P2FZ01_9BACT|nr:TlpA disulfide reductase family protein [Rhizosphaericola mali]QES88746.1 TlpA family protein disulfide reductase [Rhizosphaericola mali]